MSKILFTLFFTLGLSVNISANEEYSKWLNGLDLPKPIFQNNEFYMGVTYTGKPGKLSEISEILFSFVYEDEYSDDKRYLIRSGCKPRDCGTKGMLWIDSKDKVAIGAIYHSFWEKLDFSKPRVNQIFLFSNFYEDQNKLPNEFIKSYTKWVSKIDEQPEKFRFLNSNNKLIEIKNIK